LPPKAADGLVAALLMIRGILEGNEAARRWTVRVLRRVGAVLHHLQLVQYRRKLLLREQADRRAREHLDRLASGIHDNVYGLNGR
jgi:hypothetical protein